MLAIFKREMKSYFTSPIGYVFIAMFLAVNAFLFSNMTYVGRMTTDVGGYFNFIIFVFIVIAPMLTMKLFSEERRTRTEQLLLTSPVSLFGMVFGKFLAAFTMFGGTFIAGNIVNFAILYGYSTPNTAVILSNSLGVLLIGAAFIAIGVFVSALTENQMVAAVGTMAIVLFMLFIQIVNSYIDSYAVRVVLSWISVFSRFANFGYGIIDLAALLYYLSICFVFLFLTVRLYEKRRWS
ncbi:MAG: ABC transporter permease subunit [Clostridia bacterium]|nr:ABC transporter permease subunit [Clostridia bacterium]